ncbi:hypothetical protein [Achromobacter aegrifaciens]
MNTVRRRSFDESVVVAQAADAFGRHRNHEGTQFVFLKPALQPVVIELSGAKFSGLAIGFPDARTAANEINAAVVRRDAEVQSVLG